jgi:hypothetical protein
MDCQEKRDWQTIPQLCGHLQSVEVQSSGATTDTRGKSLRKVSVRVYKRTTADSYHSSDFVAEKITGWGGSFRFRVLHAGDYWLVAAYKGKEYMMPLRIRSSSASDDYVCSTQLFWIQSTGEFKLAEIIELD